MREESKAAAAWWAQQFRHPPAKDNGTRDPLERAFARAVLAGVQPMSEEEVQRFEAALAQRIDAMLDDPASRWDDAAADAQPLRGGARRFFGIDYHAPALMVDAARAAGISKERFGLLHPVKVSMWINPGCVRVGPGYQKPIETIYGTEPTAL